MKSMHRQHSHTRILALALALAVGFGRDGRCCLRPLRLNLPELFEVVVQAHRRLHDMDNDTAQIDQNPLINDSMDLRKLQKIAVTALEDIKARDIEVINTSKLSSMFERIIVASADSTRQVKSLARNVHDKVREAGLIHSRLRIAGTKTHARSKP